MAFEDATAAVVDILQKRQDALFKGQPIPWATHGTKSYSDFVTTKFGRSGENQAWMAANDAARSGKAGSMTEQQMIATRLKIGWLAGTERDLRTQFMAGGDGGSRTSQDQTRYAVIGTILAKLRLQRFMTMISNRMAFKGK